MNALGELMFEMTNPFIDFHAVATGGTRMRLQAAHRAWEEQRRIVAELRERFGSPDVRIASKVEIANWPRMPEGHGFKVRFPVGEAPPGWSKPEEWGTRQRSHGQEAFLPVPGSRESKALEAAGRRLRAVERESGLLSRRLDDPASSDWYGWSALAIRDSEDPFEEKGRDHGFPWARALPHGVFLLSFRSRDPDFRPIGPLADCPTVTSRQAGWIRRHAEAVAARLARGDAPLPGFAARLAIDAGLPIRA